MVVKHIKVIEMIFIIEQVDTKNHACNLSLMVNLKSFKN